MTITNSQLERDRFMEFGCIRNIQERDEPIRGWLQGWEIEVSGRKCASLAIREKSKKVRLDIIMKCDVR